jgi:hypothetical protein
MFLQQKKPRAGVAEFLSVDEEISVTNCPLLELRCIPVRSPGRNVRGTFREDLKVAGRRAETGLRKFSAENYA